MEKIAPLGPVYQAGTLSGNPVAVAAGLVTLKATRAPGFYQTLSTRTRQLTDGLTAAAQKHGISFSAQAVGGMLEGTNEMRFGDLDDLFRAARYDLKVWNREMAGIAEVTNIGLKGSPTVVGKVFAPKPRSQRAEMIETVDGDPKNLAATLLAKVFTQNPKLEKEIAKRAM